jgi:hypothetical protein
MGKLEQRHHTELWLFAFLTFVVGDSVTTALGLSGGAVEHNPLGAAVLEHGGRAGMVVFKSAVLLALYGFYYAFDRATPYDVDDVAALLVAGLGLVVTSWNAYVIVLL